MQVSQVYSVGVAFSDLGDEGTYRETLLALTHLQNVTADIFGRIEARVNLLKKRAGELNERIGDAKLRVGKVAEASTRATTVFSTSKFPENAYNQSDELGREGAGGIQHLYGDLPYMECPPDEDDAPGADAPDLFLPAAHSADAGMNESELSELYIDIKDRVNAKITAYNHDSLDYDDDGNELQGLGPLPNNLKSVSSVLLFNSTVNPYKVYSKLDNLLGVDVEVREEEEDARKRKLGAAPKTLVDGDALPEIGEYDVGYKPKMGDGRLGATNQLESPRYCRYFISGHRAVDRPFGPPSKYARRAPHTGLCPCPFCL